MQKISHTGDYVNSPDHPWELQRAIYDSIITESAGPLQTYLGTHRNKTEIAAEMLTAAAGSSTMHRRVWMQALARRIQAVPEPRRREDTPHAQD